MSECVVRMKKPKSCEECDIATKYQRFGTEICCPFMGWYADYNKCPIFLQLPEEHGRLVDVAVLKNKNMRKPRGVSSYDYGAMATVFMDMINDTPTIVPAEAERSET